MSVISDPPTRHYSSSQLRHMNKSWAGSLIWRQRMPVSILKRTKKRHTKWESSACRCRIDRPRAPNVGACKRSGGFEKDKRGEPAAKAGSVYSNEDTG